MIIIPPQSHQICSVGKQLVNKPRKVGNDGIILDKLKEKCVGQIRKQVKFVDQIKIFCGQIRQIWWDELKRKFKQIL